MAILGFQEALIGMPAPVPVEELEISLAEQPKEEVVVAVGALATGQRVLF